MTLFADPLVDTDALLNVLLYGFVVGAGVPAAFGLVLLGLDRRSHHHGAADAIGWTALAAAGALACLAALALGVLAIV
jgi:hypothetical protein